MVQYIHPSNHRNNMSTPIVTSIQNQKFVLLNHDDRVDVLSHSLKRWFNTKNEVHPSDNLGNSSLSTVVRLNIGLQDFYYMANSAIGRQYQLLPFSKFKGDIHVSIKACKVFTDHSLMRELSRFFETALGESMIKLAEEAEEKRPKKKIADESDPQSCDQVPKEKTITLQEIMSKFDSDDYW